MPSFTFSNAIQIGVFAGAILAPGFRFALKFDCLKFVELLQDLALKVIC